MTPEQYDSAPDAITLRELKVAYRVFWSPRCSIIDGSAKPISWRCTRDAGTSS
jgi:hypothetical protein